MAAPRPKPAPTLNTQRQAAGLLPYDQAVLFSTERYKQTGGRYFRPSTLQPGRGRMTQSSLDDIDRRLINHLHGGFPLCSEPYAQVARDLGLNEQDVLARLDRMLHEGWLTRFGPCSRSKRLEASLCWRPGGPGRPL